ncbi:MAG: hypothetical protein Q8P97_01225 [bacterium]|nr:hypothetical protein [bacterium]
MDETKWTKGEVKMNKVFMTVAVMVVFAISFSEIAKAETARMNVLIGPGEEVTITGYGSNEFAVKDDVERQAKKMVEGWGTKKLEKIDIQGFADKTGKKAENDRVARDRASEMKAFLETKTDAHITAISKGDSENARKVVMTVYFAGVALVPASAPVANSGRPMTAQVLYLFSLIMGIAIVVVMFIFLVFVLPRIRKNATDKTQVTAGRQRKVSETADQNVKWAECGDYLVKFEYLPQAKSSKGKAWHSPFLGRDGNRLWDKSFSRILSSTDRCLKPGSRFESQIPGLLVSGDIGRI